MISVVNINLKSILDYSYFYRDYKVTYKLSCLWKHKKNSNN